MDFLLLEYEFAVYSNNKCFPLMSWLSNLVIRLISFFLRTPNFQRLDVKSRRNSGFQCAGAFLQLRKSRLLRLLANLALSDLPRIFAFFLRRMLVQLCTGAAFPVRYLSIRNHVPVTTPGV